MSKPLTPEEERVEQLKEEFGIDKMISEKSGLPIPLIKKSLDPILVDVILKYLRAKN